MSRRRKEDAQTTRNMHSIRHFIKPNAPATVPLASWYVLLNEAGVWKFEQPIAAVVSFKHFPIREEVM
jgi:hypothetical protein